MDILPAMLSAELPSLGPYFESRFIQTQLLKKEFRKGTLILKDGLDYGLVVSELWPDKNVLRQQVLQDGKGKNQGVETEIKLEFLDVSCLHCYQEKVGDEFFDALGACKNIQIFEFKSIQALIDYKWPIAREYTIKMLFLPFLCYLSFFIAYSNAFNGQVEMTDSMLVGDKVISAFLYLFSIYFLQNECRQFLSSGLEYLASPWNYADFVPPVFIIVIVTMHLKIRDVYTENIDWGGLATIHSLASLLMWVKLLYFLRIFKQTGYLIRMLSEVISDMKVFLLILCIVMIAFGEAFLRLSEMSQPDNQFILNYPLAFIYSYRLAVGDTVTDAYNGTIQPVIVWIYFCLCLLITNVVLLNLLIAIISQSFEKINDVSVLANYQERARIIAENGYLIPNWKKKIAGDRN